MDSLKGLGDTGPSSIHNTGKHQVWESEFPRCFMVYFKHAFQFCDTCVIIRIMVHIATKKSTAMKWFQPELNPPAAALSQNCNRAATGAFSTASLWKCGGRMLNVHLFICVCGTGNENQGLLQLYRYCTMEQHFQIPWFPPPQDPGIVALKKKSVTGSLVFLYTKTGFKRQANISDYLASPW